jgi:hypothetical protein
MAATFGDHEYEHVITGVSVKFGGAHEQIS